MDQAIQTAPAQRARRDEHGYSLIEALIGAALLLMVVLGVLPLFTRAMMDNTAGADYTRATNNARSAAEQRFQLGFNNAALAIGAGATTRVDSEFYAEATKRWQAVSGSPPVGTQWLRTTTLRQYGLADVMEDDHTFNKPLDGDTFPANVHLKEIEVKVESATPGSVVGTRKSMTMRLLKAF